MRQIPVHTMDAGEFVDLCKRNSPMPSELLVFCTRWGKTTAMPEHFSLRWKGTPYNVPMGEIPGRIIWNGPEGESAILKDSWPYILLKLVNRGAVTRTREVDTLLKEAGL